jgi:enamine deaminase RidA (YjgF/YER057c/UK114 family)
VNANENELAAGLAPTAGYRYADVVGDRLHLAGQVPLDGQATLVGPTDVRAQTRQCATNLATVIEVNGFAMADIHHLTLHVVGEHQNLLDAWDELRSYFDGNVPPATLLGCPVLGHAGQLVELDARVERSRSIDG